MRSADGGRRGIAEVGAPGGGGAGATGAARAPARGETAGERAARCARCGRWDAQSTGGERVGAAHARDAAGPGGAVWGGGEADQVEGPVSGGGIRQRADGDGRRAAAADHSERADPRADAELLAD